MTVAIRHTAALQNPMQYTNVSLTFGAGRSVHFQLCSSGTPWSVSGAAKRAVTPCDFFGVPTHAMYVAANDPGIWQQTLGILWTLICCRLTVSCKQFASHACPRGIDTCRSPRTVVWQAEAYPQ